jgi:2-C-methyl-D-erythritol 4-phosphate cytidylyltransferase
MISSEIISDNIAKCRLYGSAIASIPCAEAMLTTGTKTISTSS